MVLNGRRPGHAGLFTRNVVYQGMLRCAAQYAIQTFVLLKCLICLEDIGVDESSNVTH